MDLSESVLLYDIMLRWGSHPRLMLHRQNSGMFYTKTGRMVRAGTVGSPDIEGIIAPLGTYVGIEVKALKGRQRPEQMAFQKRVVALGGLYVLAFSVTDVDSALYAFGLKLAL
jgi:hypothetical protein